MTNIQYRLVFEKLEQGAKIQKVIVFLRKKTTFAKEEIEDMLNFPPRVLLTAPKNSSLKKIQASLKKMGLWTNLEPVVTVSGNLFSISRGKYEDIKKELSKTERSEESLLLILVQIEPIKSGTILPSILTFEETLRNHFSDNNTVTGIDESRFMILTPSTSEEDIGIIRNKITEILNDIFKEKIHISIGFSLFPEEGSTLLQLLEFAELNTETDEYAGVPELKPTETPYVLVRDEGTLTPIQVCFTEARGKIFRRLLSMDPQSLLLGLSQLSNEKQREFLARLPYDSPLSPILQDAIDSNSQPVEDKAVEDDLATIVYYMEMEDGLEDRKKNQEKILSKLNRTETLPTLPSVASHVLMIASDPDSTASDLTDVIETDPSLTSKLLKVVNSAFYGFRQEIGAVKRAVVLLGTGEIIALAFGLTTAKLFNVAQLKGGYSPKALWRHSMCIGLIAENICKRFPEFTKLGVFTAGLLHDFGKILLIENFPELYGQVHVEAKKHDLPLFELEEEKFGLNHAIIGEILASNWNLPDALIQAIAFHHQPFLAPSHSQLAAIIGLADYLFYEAISTGELTDELSDFTCELTSCHWTFLGELFPGFDSNLLNGMVQDAKDIIKKSESLLFVTA